MGTGMPQNVVSRQSQELQITFFIMGEGQAGVNVSFPGAIVSQGRFESELD